MSFKIDWDHIGSDGSQTFGQGTPDEVTVSVATPKNSEGKQWFVENGMLKNWDVSQNSSADIRFDTEVQNVKFTLLDVDDLDKITIMTKDADGNLVPVEFEVTGNHHVNGNSVVGTGQTTHGPGMDDGSQDIEITIPGPVMTFWIVLDDGPARDYSGAVAVSDITFETIPALDGTVEGTAGDDVIDAAYLGDPDGDRVDNNDAILDGDAGDDDLIVAGAGEDVIKAGRGDDDVFGGADNDVIYGGAGADTLRGEDGDDVILGGGVGFNGTLDFNDLSAGDLVNGQYTTQGVTISSADPDHPVMIFDTANPTGGDHDLETNNLGNVLILSEDKDSSDPDDNAHGGTFVFDFDSPAHVASLDFLDIEGGAWIKLYDENGTLIRQIDTATTNDNGQLHQAINVDGVSKMTVKITGSGAIDNLSYSLGEGADEGDTIFGGAGDDYIDGQAGDDMLFGGQGADVIIGGEGNDKVEAAHGDDSVFGGAGDDDLWASHDNDYVEGGTGDDKIYGGNGQDELYGQQGDDRIYGGSDNDIVYGGAGNDIIDGDTKYKDDTGEAGRDKLFGGDGDDIINGNGGAFDTLFGGNGNDTLFGGEGRDVIHGGAGNDEAFGGEGHSEMFMGDGDDLAVGGTGKDWIHGDAGNDTLIGGAGEDMLKGGADRDVLFADSEDTLVDGGAGGDDYDILNLTGQGPFFLDNVVADSNGNGIDGTVVFVDADGKPTGETIDFTEIEEVVGDNIGNGPSAQDDTATTLEDTPVTIDVLANDTDPNGDPLTIVSASSPDGDVVINADGTITFTPNENFNGEATITYTVTDPDGNESTASVTVDVESVNDGPVAVQDDYSADEDAVAVLGNVLSNDSDPDGATLTVAEVNGSPAGVGQPVAADNGGLVTIAPDGTVTFDPNGEFDELRPGESAATTLTYTVTDADGATATETVTITIDGINDDPNAKDNAYVVNADESFGDIDGNVLNDRTGRGRDNDPEGTKLTVVAVGGATAAVGTVVNGSNGGEFVINADGTVDFNAGGDFDTLPLGQSAQTSVTYTIQDEDGGTDTATVTFTVGGMNDGTIQGTSGDDVIVPGFVDADGDIVDGNDAILPGDTGNDDLIFGFEGDDKINAGDGDDVVFGGTGNDKIVGGAGDDVLNGDEGNDTIFGGAGDDTLDGGNDDDLLEGGDGDDTLRGGQGRDTILGGDGDDIIDGGTGDDDLAGGFGSDTFLGGNGGDNVIGGEDPDGNDIDVLDLTGTNIDHIDYNAKDPESGVVTFQDGTTMTFSEIENVIPCFTPGTLIATPTGEKMVEDLKMGDRIITRDNGIQEIAWTGRKVLDGKKLANNPHLKPILIKAGSLGDGLPERDMLVSPNHRVLVSSEMTQLYFEEREVLAAAKHMTGARGIHSIDAMSTTYIHFMCERHEVVLSNGAWTESFQPGDYSLKGIGNSQRNEILELFPELATTKGREDYQAARKLLKKHEAQLLMR